MDGLDLTPTINLIEVYWVLIAGGGVILHLWLWLRARRDPRLLAMLDRDDPPKTLDEMVQRRIEAGVIRRRMQRQIVRGFGKFAFLIPGIIAMLLPSRFEALSEWQYPLAVAATVVSPGGLSVGLTLMTIDTIMEMLTENEIDRVARLAPRREGMHNGPHRPDN